MTDPAWDREQYRTASFYLLNGFLHVGFLLLTLGGVGLLFYAR